MCRTRGCLACPCHLAEHWSPRFREVIALIQATLSETMLRLLIALDEELSWLGPVTESLIRRWDGINGMRFVVPLPAAMAIDLAARQNVSLPAVLPLLRRHHLSFSHAYDCALIAI